MVALALASGSVGTIPVFVSTGIWYTFSLDTQRLRARTALYVGAKGLSDESYQVRICG
jgi:hypothetical protein